MQIVKYANLETAYNFLNFTGYASSQCCPFVDSLRSDHIKLSKVKAIKYHYMLEL